jgi:hypothetical protein
VSETSTVGPARRHCIALRRIPFLEIKRLVSSRLDKCRHWKHIGITDQDKIDTQQHKKAFAIRNVNVYDFNGMNVDLNISFWSSGRKDSRGRSRFISIEDSSGT